MWAELGRVRLGLRLALLRRSVLLLEPALGLLLDLLLSVALRHRLLPLGLRRHRALPSFHFAKAGAGRHHRIRRGTVSPYPDRAQPNPPLFRSRRPPEAIRTALHRREPPLDGIR